MTDQGLLVLFLFIHVLSAIVAFGPVFVFPLIGAMGGSEPMHANFGLRVSEAISRRVTIPVALTMPISGLLVVYFSQRNLFDRTSWWLLLAIVLYVTAVLVALLVQGPTVHRLIEMTSKAPPPPAPGTTPPSGPPPAVRAQVAKIQRNGIVLTILIVSIVFLMVVKPQF